MGHVLRFIVACVLFLIAYYTPRNEINTYDIQDNTIYSEKASVDQVTICTQNLHRLGAQGWKTDKAQNKLKAIAKRIGNAACDVVAVQELVGQSRETSADILQRLAGAIEQRAGVASGTFLVFTSKSNDSYIRNGYLLRRDVFNVLNEEHWYRASLPLVSFGSRPYSFARGPHVLQIQEKGSGLNFYLVNDHLKSKSNNWKDKTGTGYELFRLLSLQAIKDRMFAHEIKGDVVEVFLGDRNTAKDGAASLVFSGTLSYDDFRANGACIIEKNGSAQCSRAKTKGSRPLVPLLEKSHELGGKPLATYKRGRKFSILDEIYMSPEDLWRAQDAIGRLKVGTQGRYRKGSDHLLAWVSISLKED